MNINGKRALVFGGTSGIGLATVIRLTEGGANVTAFGRSADNIERARRSVPQSVRFEPLDVLDREALAGEFAANAPFDILVNAATGGERSIGPFLEMDLDGFQGSFRKLWGYTNTVRLGAEHMSEDGAIVLVSGFPARRARPGFAAVGAVGGAVEAFVRGIARELAPRRINIVSPGVIDTPMFPAEGEARETLLKSATANHLIPRAGTADEVAEGIMFVIGNDFVTGTTVDVDGGGLLS